MAHHRTYTQYGCQWLTIGLTHNTDADGSPRDLYTTWMPMVHHRAYTLHKTYTQHGCQWLTIGLPATVMKHNSEPGGSPWDLYATKYADGLPWDLNATKYANDFDAGRLHLIPAGVLRWVLSHHWDRAAGWVLGDIRYLRMPIVTMILLLK
jgi:hypothetical protein